MTMTVILILVYGMRQIIVNKIKNPYPFRTRRIFSNTKNYQTFDILLDCNSHTVCSYHIDYHLILIGAWNHEYKGV